jgi:hypothetical protein
MEVSYGLVTSDTCLYLRLEPRTDPMPSRRQLISNPIYRFILAAITVVLLMHLLRSSWKSKDQMSPGNQVGHEPVVRERKAVAHFMARFSYWIEKSTDW